MKRIEDYAMIGDCRTAALIDKAGSIEWLCLPFFDSPACFASLLGTRDNGHWSIHPKATVRKVSRCYQDDSLILETTSETETGKVKLTDFMPTPGKQIDIIRIIEGLDQTTKLEMEMEMELVPRFEYGSMIPMFMQLDPQKILIIRGPDQLLIRSSVPMTVEDHSVYCHFTVVAGGTHYFHLSWSPSHKKEGAELDPLEALQQTRDDWKEWLNDCQLDNYPGNKENIKRSLLVLKALTFKEAGSIVAAITTSLPGEPGGGRNWDYRFCWPRDAAMAMRAVLNTTGLSQEICKWRDWIVHATAGIPSQLSVLYKLDGSKAMAEMELPWLQGFENSRPVRVGNFAQDQLQLDIFGSVIEVFYVAQSMGMPPVKESWNLVVGLLGLLEELWREPDEGIWEVRGPRRHFVHSKLMVWAAYKWGIKSVEEFGINGPVEKWRKIQKEIFDEICQKGFNVEANCFTQYYGSTEVDASLLHIPLLEFLPVDDPRVAATVRKIEQDLLLGEGLVMRYRANPEVEGLPQTGARAFFLCGAWLGEVYVLQGRFEEARKIRDKILSLTNDVGLLAEQYNPVSKCFTGNFPQAYSHIALLRLELSLSTEKKVEK